MGHGRKGRERKEVGEKGQDAEKECLPVEVKGPGGRAVETVEKAPDVAAGQGKIERGRDPGTAGKIEGQPATGDRVLGDDGPGTQRVEISLLRGRGESRHEGLGQNLHPVAFKKTDAHASPPLPDGPLPLDGVHHTRNGKGPEPLLLNFTTHKG